MIFVDERTRIERNLLLAYTWTAFLTGNRNIGNPELRYINRNDLHVWPFRNVAIQALASEPTSSSALGRLLEKYSVLPSGVIAGP